MTNRRTYAVTLDKAYGAPDTYAARTFPKAIRLLHDAVYDLHEANGTRDRECAHHDMRTVHKLTRDVAMATIERFGATITLQVL
jgi:hypothetical protein